MVFANTAEVLDALRGYFWIALAAAVVWRLFPVIKKRVESEDFTAEVAGQKLSFSSVSKQLGDQVADLQNQVIALKERFDGTKEDGAGKDVDEGADEATEEAAGALETGPDRAQVLWVDDRPENNAFLIQSLRERDADVIEVVSTDDALAELRSNRRGYDIVISDMVRKERGAVRPLAGVDLVRRLREENLSVPVVIYASPEAIARDGKLAVEAGATGVTASPTELLTMIRIGPTTAFEASVADMLRRSLDARPFPIKKAVDFVAEQDGRRVGIEIKNWWRDPTPEQFDRTLKQLAAARERHGFERIILITREGLAVPSGISLPPWLTVMTDDQLGASPPDVRDDPVARDVRHPT